MPKFQLLRMWEVLRSNCCADMDDWPIKFADICHLRWGKPFGPRRGEAIGSAMGHKNWTMQSPRCGAFTAALALCKRFLARPMYRPICPQSSGIWVICPHLFCHVLSIWVFDGTPFLSSQDWVLHGRRPVLYPAGWINAAQVVAVAQVPRPKSLRLFASSHLESLRFFQLKSPWPVSPVSPVSWSEHAGMLSEEAKERGEIQPKFWWQICDLILTPATNLNTGAKIKVWFPYIDSSFHSHPLIYIELTSKDHHGC